LKHGKGVVDGVDNFSSTATVNALAWDDPSLLRQARLSQFLSAADQAQLSELQQQYGFYSTGDFLQNHHGLNARWFLDYTGRQWYAVFTDGVLKRWDGFINGVDSFTPVPTGPVSALVWDDPNLLLQARPMASTSAAVIG
jgi:hypothetical protein